MAELRLSRLAGQDLDNIRQTGEAEFGEERARRHLHGFERVFALLRAHPQSGQERPEFGPGIRTFSHRPHRLLYRVDGQGVLVLRIVHGAQATSRIAIQ